MPPVCTQLACYKCTLLSCWSLCGQSLIQIYKYDDLLLVLPILVIKWMSSSRMTFGMLYCQYYHPSIIGVSSPPPTFWLNDDNLQINPFDLIPNLSRPTVVKITFETKQSIKPTTYWVMIKAVSISNWEAPGGGEHKCNKTVTCQSTQQGASRSLSKIQIRQIQLQTCTNTSATKPLSAN